MSYEPGAWCWAIQFPIPSASICKSSSSFSLARRRFHAGLLAITSPTTWSSRRPRSAPRSGAELALFARRSALGAPSPRFPPAPVLPRPSAPPLASFRNPLSGTLWVFHALNPVCHPPSACLPGWVVLA
jgi:hypothetical protein